MTPGAGADAAAAGDGARSRSPRSRATRQNGDSAPSRSPEADNLIGNGGDDDDEEEEDLDSSASVPLSPTDPVSHPHFSKEDENPRVDQPLTASVAASMPHGSIWRRIARAALRLDVRASTALHRSSLFPFDLLLVPFALMCGVYGMPLLIPLVAYIESWKLAATILISTLVTTACTTIGKRSTKRLRPCPTSLARKFFDLRRLETNFSFPSGDSAQGAVVACNLYLYAMARRATVLQATGGAADPTAAAVTLLPPALLLLLMPLVMLARVYFGAHWVSDTVGGISIGWVCTQATWILVRTLFGWDFTSFDATPTTTMLKAMRFIAN